MSHSWLALQARDTARTLAVVESEGLDSWGHSPLTSLGQVTISRGDSTSSSLIQGKLKQTVSKATPARIFYASKTSEIMVQLHDQTSMTEA